MSRALDRAVIALRVVAALAAFAVTGVFTYVMMFTQFQAYDDEGYIMASVKTFFDGRPLYNGTFTQYGPFYYFFVRVFYGVTGAAVGHDATRLLTVAMWLGTALLCGLLVYRLTASLAWALAVYLQAIAHCTGLIGEPGHPQGLLLLLLTATLAVTTVSPLSAGTGIALGVLTACVTLTKVNLGVYTIAPLVVVMLAVLRRGALVRTLLGLACLALIALPFPVMRLHLAAWAMPYALVSALTLAAGCVAVWLAARHGDLAWPAAAAFAGTAALVALAIAGLTVLNGTPVRALVDGVVLMPMRFAGVFTLPWLLPAAGITLGVAAVVVAGAVAGWDPSRPTPQAIAIVLKGAFALAMAYAALQGTAPMTTIAPFTWVILLPDREPWPPSQFVPRAVLCLVAGAQLLVAYPVAGNQQSWATLLLLPAAAIAAADALAPLARLSGLPLTRLGEALLIAGVAYWYYPTYPAMTMVRGYEGLTPLGLRGAGRLHLPAQQAGDYREIVGLIRHDCETFVTMPGMGSFYFWSGKPMLTGYNATAWMTLLDDATQQRIVDQLAQHPHACVIYNESVANGWLGGRVVDDKPLVKYIRGSFHTVRTIAGYQLMERNAAPTAR